MPVLMLCVRVKVRILGVLSLTKDQDYINLDLDEDATISTVMHKIINMITSARREIWDNVVDSPVPNALILLNGVEINNLEGLSTKVRGGSEIVIIPVTHGG